MSLSVGTDTGTPVSNTDETPGVSLRATTEDAHRRHPRPPPPPPPGISNSSSRPTSDANSTSTPTTSSSSSSSSSPSTSSHSNTPTRSHPPRSPHVKQLAPPLANGSTDTSGGRQGGGRPGVSLPLVVGAAAVLVAFFAVVVVVYVCGGRKRRKRTRDGLNYYTDPSSGSSRPHPHPHLNPHRGGKIYYGNGHAAPWRPSLDHIVKHRPPPPDSSIMVGGWRAPPPPPPPPPPAFLLYTSSGDMSTNIFSGPDTTAMPPPPPPQKMALGFQKSVFTYEELAVATDGFSHSNLLGQGGFGYVHKGVLPPDGQEVAVKSLKAGSGQGEREFQAEVEIISRVHHRHLVSLVGYCIAGVQRMLVYEFVPNKTLEFHLHCRDRPSMDFHTRMKIALGAAKGVAYLHEDCHPRIIHRDIKAANILLDYNFEAMVADFGLAKLCTDDNTHISTRVMGTFGYLAPEYASSGKLTEKSDVFSFGIMLLELITGRRPADTTRSMMEDTLVDWARPLLTRAVAEGVFDNLVDPRLEDNFNRNEMIRMAACAVACVRTSSRRRPKMNQIVRALECETSIEDLNEVLIKPGLNAVLSFDSADESSNKSLPRRF